MASLSSLRVVLWGTYDTGKPRVRILRAGLRAQGVEVTECHVDLWKGVEDKSQVKGVRRWLSLLVTALCAYPKLVWRYMRLPAHDVVLVAYPGVIDLLVLRLFAWLRGTPIAWDWFLSAYDTIVLDRRLLPVRHPASWLIRAVERVCCSLADIIFMDTATHASRMERVFGLEEGRIDRVWVGAERRHFHAAAEVACPAPTNQPPLVLFYGQFIPLHGIDTIIEAARLLQDEQIDWLVVGDGQEAARIDSVLEQARGLRIKRLRWIDYQQLCATLEQSSVALGIFGSSDKAASVIPNKVFQILAAGRPLITRDSDAIRELVHPSPPQVQLIPPSDPAALAAAVQKVLQSQASLHPVPQWGIDAFDEVIIGKQLVDVLTNRLGLSLPPDRSTS